MNLGRQLKRVKQQADHLFLRSDRTDVVGELRTAEEQAEDLRLLCEAYTRSLEKILHTHATPEEKKLKKVPEYQAAEGLKEGLLALLSPVDNDDLLRNIVKHLVEVQQALGMDVLAFEEGIEKQVLNPLIHIKDEFPSIVKQKKQLKQIGLDLDAAKTRYRNNQANPSQNTKVETYREELEDAESKLDQARDTYACDIFSLLSRHREISQYVYRYVELQRDFMQKTLMRLDHVLPDMKQQLEASSCSPVYGVPLQDHLRIVQKEIAVPIQVCIQRIIEVGLYEEGIFRVAGSATKVRRLKGAFDANLVTYETLALADEHDRDYDVHVVAGALKCYLRELPEPLLTHLLHDQWLEAIRQSDHQVRLKAMWSVVNQIPPHHKANLRYLIRFLTLLTGNSASNKMSPSNIAIVIAPNLIWAQRENDEQPDLSTLGRNMSLTSEYRSIVENLVEYCDYFFKEEVDFGVHPKVPPSPLQPHIAPNGTVPPTSTAQQRIHSQGHRRNVSADLTRSDVVGGGVSTLGNVGDCESPKQPQRRKKQAPKPPPGRPATYYVTGQNPQEGTGVTTVDTFSVSGSPEQSRSKTPPRESAVQPGTPTPTARLHHSNSIKRPTAEPPRPPSLAPVKPPRPSPPTVGGQEQLSKVPLDSNSEGKPVPLGFEQAHLIRDSDLEDDSEHVMLRKKKRDGEGAPPIGFIVGDDDPLKEEESHSPKTTRSFRQSLENVLQQQAAGQPVALPRHNNMSTSFTNEGVESAPPPQAVLPIPRTSSVGESVRPVVPPTPVQRTTIPASTAPPVCKESNQTSAADRPETMYRFDKPALPEKPSLMNRSTVIVDHSKPQVPERPTVVPPRSSSSSSNPASSSDVSTMPGNEQEIHEQVVPSQSDDKATNVVGGDGVQPLSEKTHSFSVDKQQVLVAHMNTSSSTVDVAGVKSSGSGKMAWPPSTDTASNPCEEDRVPDSTHL